MNCVQLLPMWAQPVISASFGAAQFVSANDSTIQLTSRLPNIFGHDGDYVEFHVFQESAAEWTVFGSTASPDAITINDDTITLTDGTTTDSVVLAESLSTTEWTHIKLIRSGSSIQVWRATGSDSLAMEVSTLDVIPIDIDIIGKNQDALTHVYAASLNGDEGDHFSLSSPSTDVQGSDAGFSRAGCFYLSEAGNYCIMDNLSGNDGWRIEVVNVYLQAHRLKWTVGNGTETVSLQSTDVFYPEQWIAFECNLEDLQGATPGGSDTTIDGFSAYTSNFYVGSQGGTTNDFSGRLQSLLCLSAPMTSAQWTWWVNSGQFRSLSEIGASTEIATADCTNGWPLSEASGTRADIFGTDDLTEVPGYAYSPTKNNGGFESWTSSTDADVFTEELAGTTTVNQESSLVNSGTYSARVDVDSSGSIGKLIDYTFRMTAGRTYNFSIYAAISDITGSPTFKVWQNDFFPNFSLTSTSFQEFTHQFTAVDDTPGLRIETNNWSANDSVYFDDLTIQATAIGRVLGVRTTFLNTAAFTGYLRNIKLISGDFTVDCPLTTDASDIGGDSNDGTATSVTFVTEDPAA